MTKETILDNIDELFGDTTVSQRTTPEALEEIQSEVDYSDKDEGLGGFYNAGQLPPFFSDLAADFEKDFKFYWPKDPHSNKYMRFMGSINLGVWPRVIHDALADNGVQWWANGRSYACDHRNS